MTATPLESRPPIELAIGLLPPNEQSHAQVALRVLAPHLKVRCVVVPQATGDIVLAPCEDDAASIRIASVLEEVRLERPLRLMPLSTALGQLIDGLVARGDVAPAAQADAPAANVSSEAPTQDSLLSLLLGRQRPGPIEITFRSGRTLLLDARYITAHLSHPVADVLPQLQDEAIALVAAVEPAEFAARTAKGNALYPVSVEQLCWSLASGDNAPASLTRWHADEDARVALDTWPNLSTQADSLAWLGVLARLSRQGMSVAPR